ncbi:MAG: pseudouridine synthase [Erysipelotrichaceae bacterium]
MRLDKFLADYGFGSRKEVKNIIRTKRVLVNGNVVLSDKHQVNLTDKVQVDNKLIEVIDRIYLMLNKPVGYVCANSDQLYPTVFSLIEDFIPKDCFVCGRLDVDTTGFVFITNDGKLAYQISNGKKKVGKTYLVTLGQDIDDSQIKMLENGVSIDDFVTTPAVVKVIDNTHIELTIYEGRFHQVKKMMVAIGNECVNLHRLAIGSLSLDSGLALGEYRHLSEKEVNKFKGDK